MIIERACLPVFYYLCINQTELYQLSKSVHTSYCSLYSIYQCTTHTHAVFLTNQLRFLIIQKKVDLLVTHPVLIQTKDAKVEVRLKRLNGGPRGVDLNTDSSLCVDLHTVDYESSVRLRDENQGSSITSIAS